MTEFNFDTALGLFESNDPFPVDFEDAWVWYEFSRKDNAKVSFKGCGFVEGVDFIRFPDTSVKSQAGRPTEIIKMTIDCFKSWGMTLGTAKGKQVRHYFLECEKIAKKSVTNYETLKSYCKDLIQNVIAPEVEEIRKFRNACGNHVGVGQVIEGEVAEKEYSLEILNCNEYCQRRNVDPSLWNTFRKRYGQFVRVGKGLVPPKKKGRLAITGVFFEYADGVLRNIMEFV